MAVDFFTEKKGSIVYSISVSDMNYYEEVLEIFNKKYNDLFDIYNDFTLYNNHITYLMEVVGNFSNKSEELNKFYDFLVNISNHNKNLFINGE